MPDTAVIPSQPSGTLNPFTARTVTANGGQVVLAGDSWPVLGSPDAKHILICLFDYTCDACRNLHGLLRQAMELYHAAFAVMMVPVPHDPTCNRTITRPDPKHPNACAYARLAMAVWHTDSSKYPAFDAYLFAGDRPPMLGAARAYAQQLLGSDIFDPHAPDRDLDGYLHRGVELCKSIGAKGPPVLLLPHGMLSGHIPSLAKLLAILDEQLAPPSVPNT